MLFNTYMPFFGPLLGDRKRKALHRRRTPAKGDTTDVKQHWWESSHFKDTLGGLVLAELYGSLPEGHSGFGTELSSANIDSYIAGLNAARDRWEQANPDEVAFVRSLARKAGLID